MGWVHRRKQCGAILALIALALQIALTFGHVHLRGLAGGSHVAIDERVKLGHTVPQAPTHYPSDDDNYCAVCASIFLASSAFAPASPQLLVPANFQRVEHSFNVARPFTGPSRLAFRARAPPVA